MSGEEIFEKVAIPLFATFSGAFLAFRYQYSIEKNRDKRAIVQNLMMYRNVGADELEWIKAMNAAEIVFHNSERVRHLITDFFDCTDDEARVGRDEHVPIYNEMVYEMAQDCGYTQITISDIKRVYSPIGLAAHYPNRKKFYPVLGAPDAHLATLLDEISQYG
jgi:hypothetical protein